MISIQNLYKTFQTGTEKNEVLKNINIKVGDGEIYGIIGLSGAGKSSLLRCINFLEKPTSGEVIIDGVDLSSLNGRELRNLRKKTGMIFQQFNLLMSSTVYENIAFPLKISSYPKKQIEARIYELLEMVELRDKKNAYPSKLSGGQKQRVGIARALANNPSILLLDEATSALDPATTNSILELMKSINRKLGITIVVVTHEMDVIKKLCSRVAVIEEGSIVEEGRVIDVFSNPQTKTTNKFLHVENTEIPDWVDNSTDSRTIRIHFMGEETGKPYISDIINEFNVTANIISGNIEIVQNVQIGRLLVNISGSTENINNALKYLASNSLRIEVFEDDSFKYI